MSKVEIERAELEGLRYRLATSITEGKQLAIEALTRWLGDGETWTDPLRNMTPEERWEHQARMRRLADQLLQGS